MISSVERSVMLSLSALISSVRLLLPKSPIPVIISWRRFSDTQAIFASSSGSEQMSVSLCPS